MVSHTQDWIIVFVSGLLLGGGDWWWTAQTRRMARYQMSDLPWLLSRHCSRLLHFIRVILSTHQKHKTRIWATTRHTTRRLQSTRWVTLYFLHHRTNSNLVSASGIQDLHCVQDRMTLFLHTRRFYKMILKTDDNTTLTLANHERKRSTVFHFCLLLIWSVFYEESSNKKIQHANATLLIIKKGQRFRLFGFFLILFVFLTRKSATTRRFNTWRLISNQLFKTKGKKTNIWFFFCHSQTTLVFLCKDFILHHPRLSQEPKKRDDWPRLAQDFAPSALFRSPWDWIWIWFYSSPWRWLF